MAAVVTPGPGSQTLADQVIEGPHLQSFVDAGAFAPSRVLKASDPIGERGYQQAVEDFLREGAKQGGVFPGRAAAIVLRDAPAALHVRLYGPRDRRDVQAR